MSLGRDFPTSRFTRLRFAPQVDLLVKWTEFYQLNEDQRQLSHIPDFQLRTSQNQHCRSIVQHNSHLSLNNQNVHPEPQQIQIVVQFSGAKKT